MKNINIQFIRVFKHIQFSTILENLMYYDAN